MKKIIIHWTAGNYLPNETDLTHYHYLVTGNGNVVNGKFKPEDNLNCTDGRYAAHTGGGNTGAIGIALCGMLGFSTPNNTIKFPLKKIQCEKCFEAIANLAKKYKIPISKDTIMTHYEFGIKNPQTSSAGKIDIIYLPPYPDVTKSNIGNFIRNKVLWYYLHN